MRTPSFNNGDIQAMIAACELANRRYAELLGRYGEETVLGVARAWLEYSEQMLRQEIAKVPDGRYETEVGWLDDDGRTRGVQLPVKVAVVIEGDEITFDLTGSSDEVPTGYNCPFEGTTVSAMTFITRMIFLDEATYPVFVPQNEGMLAAGQRDRAAGLDLQPELPARVLRALLPGAARGRPRAAGARAGHPRQDHRRQLGAPRLPRLLRLQRGGGRVLGLPRGRRGLLRRPARGATASTRSTA